MAWHHFDSWFDAIKFKVGLKLSGTKYKENKTSKCTSESFKRVLSS